MNKLLYGVRRLVSEFTGKLDYWHTPLILNKDISNESYYLDMSKKGEYPFLLRNGIPILNYNGKEVEFATTIFNYGLGLLELNKEKECNFEINAVIKWTIQNQNIAGAWVNNFEELAHDLKPGWISGMSQGLGVSFLVRCYYLGLIARSETIGYCEKAINCMMSSPVLSEVDGNKFIEEYPSSNNHVLNGFIFSLWGVLDYCNLINDYARFSELEKSLSQVLGKYKFGFWSYYDLDNHISSTFYHCLHIEQLKSIYHLTNNPVYIECIRNWQKGLKFKAFYIFLKSVQKLYNYRKIATLNQ